ncbi:MULTISPECIES: hypothetical protein [unclassified Luteococcus]|uniref:hypothetical protein n=1 Tax=unclassified Luteococcus TaxID=2639923 RepID=UPI00313B7579
MNQPAPSLATAVALALTGERPAVPAPGSTQSPQDLVDFLARLGWDAGRIAHLRQERQHQGLPWPFVVPREELAPVGFARTAAVVKEVRQLLGVDGLVVTRHQGPKVIGPAERRLLAERPPHHGNVG